MTDNYGTSPGFILDLDTLADLQAGVFDDDTSAALWEKANADPAALELLAALDGVNVDLAELTSGPPPAMPAHLAASLEAALIAEASARAEARPMAPVVDLAAARTKRARRLGSAGRWGTGVAVAAAAIVAVVVTVSPRDNGSTSGNVAQNTPQPTGSISTNSTGSSAGGPLALTGGTLSGSQLSQALRLKDAGGFADQVKLSGCLAANGISPGSSPTNKLAAIGPVTVNGAPATLMLLTKSFGQWQLLVVNNSCDANNPATVTNTTIGTSLPTASK